MNTLNGIFSQPKPASKNYLVENKKNVRQKSGKLGNNIMKTPTPSVTSLVRRSPIKEVADGIEYPRVRQKLVVHCRNQCIQTENTDDFKPLELNNSPLNILTDNNSFSQSTVLSTDTSRPNGVNIELSNFQKSPKLSLDKEISIRTCMKNSTKKRFNNKSGKGKVQSERDIDPDCPPGHVALGNIERLEMLEKLKESFETKINELNKLPVRADTLRIRLKKIEIDKQLDQIEDGIKLFSKLKVYVKHDDKDNVVSV